MADSVTNSAEFEKHIENLNENIDNDEDFEMECSDEEMRGVDGKEWEPGPEEVVCFFEELDKKGILELEWTTPGRRPPTPAFKLDSYSENDCLIKTNREEKSDFDFQDEMSSLKVSAKGIRPVGTDVGPRGSAKKKTTSLDAILSSMARHRKLDMMEDDDGDLLP